MNKAEPPRPLTPAELEQMDKGPVYIKGLGDAGLWDIFSLDEDGNWIFILTEFTKGQLVNDTLAQAVRDGVMSVYDRTARIDLL